MDTPTIFAVRYGQLFARSTQGDLVTVPFRSSRRSRAWTRPLLVGGLLGLVAAGCASSSTSPTTNADAGAGAVGTTGGTASGAGGTAGGAPGSTAPAVASVTYPGASWATVDPAAAGFDTKALDDMATAAQAGGSNCLLVTRNGKLVKDWYWNGTSTDSSQEVFSATKSYSSTLVGIAQDEGKLSLTDSASKYIPAWKGTPAEAITVKNLVSNDSGRHWDYQTDYFSMAAGAKDKTQFAEDLAQDFAPGETWVYNNSAIQTLDDVISKATGVDTAAYAKDKLLGPIGMAHSEMTKDPSGNTLTFMGLHSTCQDMARFGWLMLNQGNWDGKQVVSKDWAQAATGQPSQPLNAAYGYLWWLNRKGVIPGMTGPTSAKDEAGKADGQMVPGAPDNVFWALGLGDQMIAIFPSTGVVAVRLGPTHAPEGAKQFQTKELTLGTQAALTKP